MALTQERIEELKTRWVKGVFNKAKLVDPENDYIWKGILIGWLIGSGVSIEEAHQLACSGKFEY